MTTYYVNFYQHATADTMVGYFYPTEQEAGSAAGRIVMPPHHRTAVPIEVPDPPHVWKIGDWFRHPVGTLSWQLIDLVGPRYAWATRDIDIPLAGSGESPTFFDNLIPCDPPQWFINQQNEAT